jgi:hypothetical protein
MVAQLLGSLVRLRIEGNGKVLGDDGKAVPGRTNPSQERLLPRKVEPNRFTGLVSRLRDVGARLPAGSPERTDSSGIGRVGSHSVRGPGLLNQREGLCLSRCRRSRSPKSSGHSKEWRDCQLLFERTNGQRRATKTIPTCYT